MFLIFLVYFFDFFKKLFFDFEKICFFLTKKPKKFILILMDKLNEKIIQNEPVASNKIWTIPNIISMLRILLVPLIIWLYLVKKDYFLAGVFVVVSGLTDMVDGFIARRFNMVSNLGKILDPIADKLTQMAVLVCLVFRFPHMIFPLILLVVKEIALGISGLYSVKKSKKVYGANWHGKVATTVLYLTMGLHIFWIGITPIVSDILIVSCCGLIILTGVLYVVRNIQIGRHASKIDQE